MAPSRFTKRATGFSQLEIDNMLETIGIILPVAGMEWESVEREHEGCWPDKQRTKESLKRKFQSLYRKKVPTGDPNCPPDVLSAKRIQENIKEKVEMSECESEEEDNGGDDDDGVDDDDDDNNAMNDVSSPSARTVMVAEVVADLDCDTSVNGASTISAGTPSFSAGTLNASIERASRTRTKKKKKYGNVLNQVVSKQARSKNYGDDDEEEFSMNSYFKMMMVERQNERKEEKERRLDEVEERRSREAQQERRHKQQMAQQNSMQNMMMMQMFCKHPPTTAAAAPLATPTATSALLDNHEDITAFESPSN